MGLRRVLHLVLCLLLAVVATGSAHVWSERYYRGAQIANGLDWARQVASQLDALTLHAREKSVADPLGWAVGVLRRARNPE
jgi:hypothetical protein